MNIPSLSFNDAVLSPIKHNNQIWLTTSELSTALGYARSDSLNKIYERNKDEFSVGMTAMLPARQNDVIGESKGLQPMQRLFSLRGCHLIAMFSKTAIAKQFRVWVLDILDKEASKPQPITESLDKLSPAQQCHIQTRVKELVKTQTGTTYAALYGQIKRHFDIGTYKDLPASHYAELCKFLECEPIGELLPTELVTFTRIELHNVAFIDMNENVVIPKAKLKNMRIKDLAVLLA